MINFVLPNSKGNGIKPGTVQTGAFGASEPIRTSCGIPKIERVLSDNAFAYRKSTAFKTAVTQLGAQQRFIKPHGPGQRQS